MVLCFIDFFSVSTYIFLDLFDITKKSPEDRSWPVTVIFGIWKNPFVNVTDFVPVPDEISSPVSVLFSNTNLAIAALALGTIGGFVKYAIQFGEKQQKLLRDS